MSRMVDVKKCHRGVLLWREDILKCERLKKPLSGLVRDLLHKELGGYTLDVSGKTALDLQIVKAMTERKRKHPGRRGHKRSLTVDVMAIPAKVRKAAKFVAEK